MDCLKCELIRAAVKALIMIERGYLFQEVTDALNAKYGPHYFVSVTHRANDDLWAIYRANKLPPFNHDLIIDRRYPKCQSNQR